MEYLIKPISDEDKYLIKPTIDLDKKDYELVRKLGHDVDKMFQGGFENDIDYLEYKIRHSKYYSPEFIPLTHEYQRLYYNACLKEHKEKMQETLARIYGNPRLERTMSEQKEYHKQFIKKLKIEN